MVGSSRERSPETSRERRDRDGGKESTRRTGDDDWPVKPSELCSPFAKGKKELRRHHLLQQSDEGCASQSKRSESRHLARRLMLRFRLAFVKAHSHLLAYDLIFYANHVVEPAICPCTREDGLVPIRSSIVAQHIGIRRLPRLELRKPSLRGCNRLLIAGSISGPYANTQAVAKIWPTNFPVSNRTVWIGMTSGLSSPLAGLVH